MQGTTLNAYYPLVEESLVCLWKVHWISLSLVYQASSPSVKFCQSSLSVYFKVEHSTCPLTSRSCHTGYLIPEYEPWCIRSWGKIFRIHYGWEKWIIGTSKRLIWKSFPIACNLASSMESMDKLLKTHCEDGLIFNESCSCRVTKWQSSWVYWSVNTCACWSQCTCTCMNIGFFVHVETGSMFAINW